MENTDYNKNLNKKLTIKLRRLLDELPEFCDTYFRGISDQTQIRTRVAYAFDLRIFFYYLLNYSGKFTNYSSIRDFVMSDLDKITAIDIEKYTEFLNYYTLPNYKDPSIMVEYSNTEKGKMRKLSTLRSFYKYFYKKELIKNNPTVLVDLPKLHEKPIIRLEPNEVVELLDDIEDGKNLTKKQQEFHNKTGKRDLALISLLLGTGIRISECVGLNISDFDFEENSFVVTRKGGDRTILYLSDEVKEIIKDYLYTERLSIFPARSEDADAMFLSLQKRRLSVSSIEKMLKKYTSTSVPLKQISPHKLRSTFGTNLYRETGDIYLVADVLGHKDVNTTRKHYAAIEDDKRRQAAKVTKLRKD